MRRDGRLAAAAPFLVAAMLLTHGVVRASSPLTWEYPSRENRAGGAATDGVPAAPRDGESVDGVSQAEDGRLSLSVPMREVFPALSKLDAPPLLWAAGLDAQGNLYLGTGNGGEVLRLDRKGSPSPLFDSDDLGVRALAVSPSGELYAATFPEGAVFRLSPGQEPEPWFAPEERYLWALAADPAGRLFVATGERGIIYQVKGKADGDVFFDSDESHIMSLAFDRDGSLIAGTDPDGLLYRISPDGKPEVLLDTDLREIPAVVVTPDGVIYAAALGEEPRQPQRKPGEKSDLTIEVTPASDGNVLEEQADVPRKITIDLGELLPSLSARSEGSAGRIYRIEPGRPPVLVWKSDTQRVYSLAWAGERGLFFGTGGADEARIYHLEEDGSATTLYRLAERQVTALLAQADGRLYACTSNPGRVYLLDTGTISAGTYVAPVHDAGREATWGTLSWEAEIPAGTRIEIATRSGNRPAPDESWSGWSAPAASGRGSAIQSPPGRYLQWKAELSRIKTDEVPILDHVLVTALPENRRPVIASLRVMEPKTGFAKPVAHAGASAAKSAPPAENPEPGATPDAKDGSKDKTMPPAGARWVVFSAGDPDGDALARALSIRKEDEAEFRPLASDLPAEPYALVDADLPEGRYVLKLEVDDSPDNGTQRMLDSHLVSDAFLVDHTAPRLKITPSSGPATGRLVASVTAEDAIGLVARGEYSVAGAAGPWKPLPCEDGICDTSSERFLVDLPAGAAPSGVTLRVSDAAGNTATIEVPPASR